jgi:hypothetical protein
MDIIGFHDASVIHAVPKGSIAKNLDDAPPPAKDEAEEPAKWKMPGAPTSPSSPAITAAGPTSAVALLPPGAATTIVGVELGVAVALELEEIDGMALDVAVLLASALAVAEGVGTTILI